MKFKWMTIAVMGVAMSATGFVYAGGDHYKNKSKAQAEMEEVENVTQSTARGYNRAEIHGEDDRAGVVDGEFFGAGGEEMEAEEEFKGDQEWITTEEEALDEREYEVESDWSTGDGKVIEAE